MIAKKSVSIFFCLLLVFSVYAVETDTVDDQIAMSRGSDTDFQTDTHFTITSVLANASTGGTVTFYKPLPTDTSDLPTTFYMCAGDLDLNSFAAATWNENIMACAVDYPYGANIEPICPQWDDEATYYPDWENRDRNGACDFPPNCMQENPWTNPSTANAVQWNSEIPIDCCDGPGIAELIQCLQNPDKTNIICPTTMTTTEEWSELTALYNINCDYIPLFGCPPYPNQKALGALVCDADLSYDTTTVHVEPGNPSLQTTASFPTVGTYTVDPELSVNDCRGVVRKLPDSRSYNTAHYQYYFRENLATYPQTIANNYTVNVVDPDNCSATGEAVPPTKSATTLRAGQAFNHRVRINHPHSLFDLVPTGVINITPPNWKVEIISGLGTPIETPSGNLTVRITPPDPLGEIPEKICFNITFNSSLPFCNGSICSNMTEVCINLTNRTKPDILAVVTARQTGGNSQDENEVYEVVYHVEEIAGRAAGPFNMTFGIQSNGYFTTENVPGLMAGGEYPAYPYTTTRYTIECASPFFGKGWHMAELWADWPPNATSYGQVDEEIDITNNYAFVVVRCGLPYSCWDLV